jgi:hypothetical protein
VAGEYWYWKDHRKYNISGYLKPRFENLERNPATEPLLVALLCEGTEGVI